MSLISNVNNTSIPISQQNGDKTDLPKQNLNVTAAFSHLVMPESSSLSNRSVEQLPSQSSLIPLRDPVFGDLNISQEDEKAFNPARPVFFEDDLELPSVLPTIVQTILPKAISVAYQTKSTQPQGEEKSKKVGEKRKTESTQSIEAQKFEKINVPEMAFGKAKWEKYFGDVGVEPALPQDIVEILNSSCPFWPDKKVRETHLLVLIPDSVNGKSFHLNNLSELINSPRCGHKTRYSDYSLYVEKELGTKNLGSHWVLMTKDVIPESRIKTCDDQKVLVQKYIQASKIPYQLPKALEAATVILMHYVETGEALYTDNSLGKEWTYTRCQEKVHNNEPVAIGGFSSGGLRINYSWNNISCYDGYGSCGGIGVCRRV